MAEELTKVVHGAAALQRAQQATRVIFNREPLHQIPIADLFTAFKDAPSINLPREKIVGREIVALAVECGAAKSKSEARRAVSEGGLYVNNVRVEDPRAVMREEDVLDGALSVLRVGKKSYYGIMVEKSK